MGAGGIGFGAELGGSVKNPLDQIMPEDLAHYGIIPELIGRLPVISTRVSSTKKSWLAC